MKKTSNSSGKDFNFKMSKAVQGKGGKTTKKNTYIGARFNPKKNRKWYSIIKYNRKDHYLGCYTEEEHAAIAYDIKAIEFYGEDATRNFPELSLEKLTKKLEKIKEEEKQLLHDFPARWRQGRIRKSPTSSMYSGVSYDRTGCIKKWTASIRYQNKAHNIGYFKTEEEAALAYDKKAVEIYGENAKLNNPKTKKILSKKTDPSDPEKK